MCPRNAPCDTVVNSAYATTLGIPNEILGVAYYTIVGTLYALTLVYPMLITGELVLALAIATSIGVLLSIYFIALQAFVLRAWCLWCLGSAVANIVLLIALFGYPTHDFFALLAVHKTWWVIIHNIGFILGLGGATITDVLFFKFLKDNNVSIWDEWADENGNLGPVYGHQWRNWNSEERDQISEIIEELKTNPNSRRMLVSAWNPSVLPDTSKTFSENVANNKAALPPCHAFFQFYVSDSKLSCQLYQRSADIFLGDPFNIASYGLLLEIIAKAVNMVPDELIGNLGDTHLYLNHIEQAKEQIGRELTDEERYNIWFTNNYETGMERYFDPNNLPNFDDEYYTPTPKRTREPYLLPVLKHMKTDEFYKSLSEDQSLFHHLNPTDFMVENYQSHPTIKAPLSN